MMGSGITRNQWEINNDSKGHDLSSMMVLHGSHDHGGLAERGFCDAQVQRQSNGAAAAATTATDWNLGIGERVLSAAGAAFLSAIIVNPLDVVKTRLQAQAAGVAYSHPLSNIISRMAYFGPTMVYMDFFPVCINCITIFLAQSAIDWGFWVLAQMFADLRCSPSCTRAGIHGTVLICPPDCFQYKGTLDVFYKIIRQEGFARLWRGTNAGLALAVPTVGIYLPCYDLFRNWLEDLTAQNIPGATPYVPLVAGSLARSLACATCYPIELARTRMQAFKATQTGKPPGVWKTLLEVLSHVRSTNNVQNTRGYRFLWTGMGAQLARDVPYSAICWSTLEPIRRRLLSLVGEESNGLSVFGANFSASFVAGSLAAAATCPLDVAKTRRQIEKDPVRALRMTTRQTLMEVWRDGGIRALFTGVGPRVGRAGPSVGIVVSFYEVVKYALHHRYATSE
ncbi:PREDICTED: mitochondrial carrier protein MTM1-like isoform X3 [Populus euphratica]|uniref:Mitochondrial carrier protein MTM1-like isoform X3 n=1 Tax=Populus euphratica TaxID=75702 RepID=A0AAJ6X161_POPEU|nr:PREDICTED: mitochondrial carrier protein MTM1-like isoform X3 [Populus euphratica]